MARLRYEQWRNLVDTRVRCRRGPDEVEGTLQGVCDRGLHLPAHDALRARAWRIRVSETDFREIRPEDGWDIERVEPARAE